MAGSSFSRRSFLAGGAFMAACGHRKATGFRGYCFIANQGARSVAVLDLTRFRIRRHIPLDAAPSEVIAIPNRPKVLVLARETGTVYEIEASKLEVTRRARAGNSAAGMRLSPAGDAVWVLYNDPAALVEIPVSTLHPQRRIHLAASPDTIDICAESNQAAIGNRTQRSIEVASLSGGRIERVIATTDEPSLTGFRKDGRHVFVASRPERVLRIHETATGRTVVRLPLPIEPLRMTSKPDGGQLFISGPGMDAVVVVYVYQTEIAETLLAGRAPAEMAAMDTPAYLIAANPETNTVTILDLENDGRLVASVQVGQSPGAIVVTPAVAEQDQYALVLNEGSGDVAVIRINSLPRDAESRRRPTPLFTLIPVGEKPVGAAVMSFA